MKFLKLVVWRGCKEEEEHSEGLCMINPECIALMARPHDGRPTAKLGYKTEIMLTPSGRCVLTREDIDDIKRKIDALYAEELVEQVDMLMDNKKSEE